MTFFNVQQAVFDTLSASAEVQALLGNPPRLYDHAPADAVFPYVTFGAVAAQPFDDLDRTGCEQNIALTAWSRYRGAKEAKDILAVLHDALHRAELSVSGDVFVSCEFAGANIAIESDGLTTKAEIRFTIMTQSS